ncbi:reverse transcriptase domain-containing protein [Tanacetum coccineum]
MPRDCLRIIESKSKVCNSRNKPVVAKVSTSNSTHDISPDVAELKDMVKALLLDKKNQSQAPAPVKAVEENYVTCGGAHSYRNCPATNVNVYRDNIQEYASQAAATNFNQGNTGYRAPIHLAPATTSVSKDDFQNYIKANDAVMRNMQNQTQNMLNQMTNLIDLLTKFMNSNAASTSAVLLIKDPRFLLLTSLPPEVVERETEVTKDTVLPTNNGSTKDVQPPVVQVENHVPNSEPVVAPVNLHFDISFADALILMPKSASTLKSLISNKENLFELARTLLNEHCSAVLLKKLPEKLGDPSKYLIPCDFPGMDECLALADLGTSINLMPLSVWKKLSLPELTPTCMTLELADPSITQPIGIVEDVYAKVGKFQFPADFVVVDFDADPRNRNILSDQTSRYSSKYDDNSVNRIDVIEMACEEYSQEVLSFSDVIASGNPTPYYDPIVSTSSPTLALEDDPTSLKVDESYYDPEGDILLFESFLNDDPSLPHPTQGNYLPEIQKELKVCEAKNDNSSIDEPPEVELKDLPPHLEYAFLEGDNKLPAIIAKDLSVEKKAALIKVLKSHKRAIAWKLSDIKGINPEFCTHKILMEEDYKPAVQHQRRVNPKIHDVIKKEVEKLLDTGLIYPISDSP